MRINVKDYFALSLEYVWWFNAKPRVLVTGFVTPADGSGMCDNCHTKGQQTVNGPPGLQDS